jgi:hypothetical protein
MIKGSHILIGAGAVAAIYFGGSYLLKLNRLSNELESDTKVSIHNVSLSGIELAINVKLKNPSGGSIQVKHPFVKMIYADKTIASSQVKDVNLTIPKFSEVNLAPTEFRLVRFGLYPPMRGTLCQINEDATYLFTTGFMKSLSTYPGPHIPVPIQIKTDPDRDIDLVRVASDVLALARMNWNTASITGGRPVTLLFSRRVGGIMAEYGEDTPPSSLRFYI